MMKYRYIAIDIFSGQYHTIISNKLHKNGEIVKWYEIKEQVYD